MKRFTPENFTSIQDLTSFLVAPVSQNRDSDILEKSNFQVVTKEILAKASHKETKIHSFDHWACGWVEHLLIHPEDEAAIEAGEEWESRLKEVAYANDEHYSNMQSEAYQSHWEDWAKKEFVEKILEKLGLEWDDNVREFPGLSSLPSDIFFEDFLMEHPGLQEFYERLAEKDKGEYHDHDGYPCIEAAINSLGYWEVFQNWLVPPTEIDPQQLELDL